MQTGLSGKTEVEAGQKKVVNDENDEKYSFRNTDRKLLYGHWGEDSFLIS